MFEIKKYTPDVATQWNCFVAASKNGTCLFDRSYMDYHADRFHDFSLLIYRRGKLYAVLPGNVEDDTFYSHQGLTYGGLIMSGKTTAADVVEIFRQINGTLRDEGVKMVVYKPVPWIYHEQPAEEDLYAITQLGDVRITRGLSSAVARRNTNEWYRIRKSGALKALKAGVTIGETTDFRPFWSVLSHNLQARYGLNPVHTVEEMELLHQRFPQHIRLFVAKEETEVIGGCVLYVTRRVVHSQYIAASERGRGLHALDLLFNKVISMSLTTHDYFDFGISTEKQGTYLNKQLIYQKEGFGARGVCYDWYKWML
jgi:hypothetical protein